MHFFRRIVVAMFSAICSHKNTKVLPENTPQRSGDIFWETRANVALESHRNRGQQNRIVTTCNNVFD